MLHNEARKLLVKAYEKTHDAKGMVLAYGVSTLPRLQADINALIRLRPFMVVPLPMSE